MQHHENRLIFACAFQYTSYLIIAEHLEMLWVLLLSMTFFCNRGCHHTVLASCTAPCQLDILQRLCFHFLCDLDIVHRAVAQLLLEAKASCEGLALTVDEDCVNCGASDVVRFTKQRLQ